MYCKSRRQACLQEVLHDVRIELVDEQSRDVNLILNGYESVLDGTEKPSIVWNQLQSIQDSNGRTVGVSLGSLRNMAQRRAGEV